MSFELLSDNPHQESVQSTVFKMLLPKHRNDLQNYFLSGDYNLEVSQETKEFTYELIVNGGIQDDEVGSDLTDSIPYMIPGNLVYENILYASDDVTGTFQALKEIIASLMETDKITKQSVRDFFRSDFVRNPILFFQKMIEIIPLYVTEENIIKDVITHYDAAGSLLFGEEKWNLTKQWFLIKTEAYAFKNANSLEKKKDLKPEKHFFYTEPLSFVEHLIKAMYGRSAFEQSKELTEFGSNLITLLHTSQGPIIDLCCGKSIPGGASRCIPLLAKQAGIAYIGVDESMSRFIIENARVALEEIRTNGSTYWENSAEKSEWYINADMLQYLESLFPFDNETPTFYLSGIEFQSIVPGENEHLVHKTNASYMKKCLLEMKRLKGNIILGFGISSIDFALEELLSLGYSFAFCSEFPDDVLFSYPDLRNVNSYDAVLNDSKRFIYSSLHRCFILNK